MISQSMVNIDHVGHSKLNQTLARETDDEKKWKKHALLNAYEVGLKLFFFLYCWIFEYSHNKRTMKFHEAEEFNTQHKELDHKLLMLTT